MDSTLTQNSHEKENTISSEYGLNFTANRVTQSFALETKGEDFLMLNVKIVKQRREMQYYGNLHNKRILIQKTASLTLCLQPPADIHIYSPAAAFGSHFLTARVG